MHDGLIRWLRLALPLLLPAAFSQGIITTVAGTDWSFPPTPLVATNAPLSRDGTIAIDGNGNLYVADSGNNMVFRVTPDGTLTVLAGNGTRGFSGDNGPAASAALSFPVGVAVDVAGNVFIADAGNRVVRRVTPAGIISTPAGNGTSTYSGDGGPATSAGFYPAGVAVDGSGDLYIADTVNERIRKVTPDGIISTVAGNGTFGFTGDGGPATSAELGLSLFNHPIPAGIAVDLAGDLFIADLSNNRIRKVTPSGIISTVAGNGVGPLGGGAGDGGPATKASVFDPIAVTVDPAGNLYIADAFNYRIRKVNAAGIISTVAGNGMLGYSGDGGLATNATLGQPSSVAVDASGNLLIADGNSRIRKVAADGIISTVVGNGMFRFGGDGGPATSAVLNGPLSIAVDTVGNLFTSDWSNNRIRKVTPAGIISTIAGNGTPAYSGDGGQATTASLNGPECVTVDTFGNVFIADSYNFRIRKVTPAGTISTVAGGGGDFVDGGRATSANMLPEGVAVDANGNLLIADRGFYIPGSGLYFGSRIRKVTIDGIISTVAGNGTPGYSGDGGPATSAALDNPTGLAIDSTGNLFIEDMGNDRIRKVTAGLISTVAGDGTRGYSGDGGPATSAALGIWFGVVGCGVTVDATGNVFFGDTVNHVIRKVSPAGIISTVVGTGMFGNPGDGGPATSATLTEPEHVAMDSAGNLYIADLANNRIREVLADAPSFPSPVPSGVFAVSAISGGKPVTSSMTVTTLSGSSATAVPGMAYTAQVATRNPWLSVSPQSGSTPGLLTVKADPFNLAPGNYQGTIAVTVPLANPTVRTVNVQFTVGPAVASSLAVDRDHLSFTYARESAARDQTISVSNSGGGSLSFTTAITLDSGQAANWLSVTPQSGTATPSSPAVLNVRADPSSLPPGTYTGHVTITGATPGTGSIAIPVAMTITTNPLILLLSQTGLTFTAVQNGGAIPSQTFGVLNLGSGVLNWTVQTSTLRGGNWLLATPNSGSSDAASAGAAPLVTVSVNPVGLPPGVYYGLVKVLSQGAANTPQEVIAALQVLPAGTDVAPIVRPSGLIFTRAVGNSSPGSQNVLVYDPTGTSKSFRSGKTTVSGGSWFVTLPGDATIAPDQPTRIVVQPIVDSLAPGTYQGTLTLQFSDGRVSTVGITFIVTAGGGAVTSAVGGSSERAAQASGCTPKQLLPSLISLGTGFNVPAGYPQGLEAQVVDDCGVPQLSGTVFVEFSNGDPPVKLSSLNNGRWDGTWKTSAQQVSQVILTVTAKNPDLQLQGGTQVTGGLGAQQPSPVVAENGVVSAASLVPQVPLAPGGLISIFGQRLSEGTSSAPSGPLPLELASTRVTIGDQLLPLQYASDGQVNALVPFEINTNTNQQLLVQRGTTYATPVYVDVAAAQPAVFQSGQQPLITDAKGNLIGPGNPAHAGDAIMIYCAGLGVVNPPVADGTVTPDAPLSNTANPVTVTIGGQNPPVSFAGLTPEFTGLYQINVTVPQGVTPGDRVAVALSVGGQMSRTVSTSIR